MDIRSWLGSVRYISAKKKAAILLFASFVAWYTFSLPERIFDSPYCSVLEASNGQLLSASIASDGQWRFPPTDRLPEKFAEALITFEDRRFYAHPGFDPFALARALFQNATRRKVISGGSTITMQVIRLSGKTKARTFFEKAIEIIRSTRLELSCSKKEILSLYASHAPFGGNVVGLDAACWRYFGSPSNDLSWGQAALLAVLPNAPSLIHPGKNRSLLKQKRDRLLDELWHSGKINELTCTLSKEEPLPEKPRPLPTLARHLLGRMKKEGHSEKIMVSTIDYNLQERVEQIMEDHRERLVANRIFNGAALVLEVKTGRTLAYIGNIPATGGYPGKDVDIITSPRSTGSILKPFLFAAAMDEGLILPQTLLPDIPVFLNGFSPKNFSKEYDGAVHANRALIRSLNIPAVFLLRDYRYEKFYTLLQQIGLTTLTQPPDHYGLSLILGGAEGTLWDITGMYASMSRTLNQYFDHPGSNRYARTDFHQPTYHLSTPPAPRDPDATSWLSASSIYLTFDMLKELYRPGEESGWKYFNTSKKIAWKTGTSFGFRDGWAVGVNPDYAVGVWIGNADGEGRPGLTGTNTAAPVLFDIFSQLPGNRWFDLPVSEMQKIAICKKSGQKASVHCEETDTIWIGKNGLETRVCAYHKVVHLSKDLASQVHSACADVASMKHVNWFVLPPVQEYYYKAKNISYKPLPPFRKDCQSATSLPAMDLVYPKANARIFIPRDFNGQPGSSIFELAHRDENAIVFWHLDGVYIGSTKRVHRMPLNADEGPHVLTLTDQSGESLVEHFTVISHM